MAANSFVTNVSDNLFQSSSSLSAWLGRVPALVWRRGLIVILSLWLVYSLSQLFWLLMPFPDIAEPTVEAPSNIAFKRSDDNGGPAIDIVSLKKLTLFGDANVVIIEEPVVKTAGIEDNAVETNLPVEVVATTVSNSEALTSAMILHRGKQKIYYMGDELDISPSGVKLAKVLSDRVILDNRGTYESKFLFAKVKSTGNARQDRVSSNRASAGRNSRAASEFVGRGGPVDPDLVDQFVDEVRPVAGQTAPTERQVKAITDVVKVQMHRENGEFVGFKIRPGRNRELFETLGLQPNDVVVAINQTRLTDMQKAMEEYRALGKSTEATLEILRDGYSETVTVNLEETP